MTPAPLADRLHFCPAPFDARAGARPLAGLANAPPADIARFIEGVAGCSPYLARLIERAPEAAIALFAAPPEAALAAAGDKAWRAADEPDLPSQMKALRAAKSQAALAIAFAEISQALTTMEAAALYSAFADAAAGSAARMALRGLAPSGFKGLDAACPETGSGLAVIAMGKLGASELNFSSDIDVVILFDTGNEALGNDARKLAVAAAKTIVRALNDQTADGYVFRTDIRLRPDPGVSAAAVSVNAAEAYYQSFGQNWERAAFIKARAHGGDLALGEEFIRRLKPFIWRKYLDFAQIDDIHSILAQIRASTGNNALTFHGADLKRGPGGIREIEFFAQGQQLIGGGKNPSLRAPATLGALGALASAGVIAPDAATALAGHYKYLRRVEHRLQMIADEQTHRIPPDTEGASRLAAFLGEASLAAFEQRLIETFSEVRALTAPFYAPQGARRDGNREEGGLVFSGVDNDPGTLEALTAKGFERPGQVLDSIRRWRAGETPATRSERSRDLLARMTPQLIDALARAGAPDEAFAAFDGFLRSLPSGVQIFSLFVNRPEVFDRLIRIMTVSPFLARATAKKPHLVEALLESRWPDPAPTPELLTRRLGQRLAAADGYEGALNAARRWASEENFSAAAQLLVEAIGPDDAALRFTLIAETAISALLDEAARETARLYGAIDVSVAVIALGRLGARAMTAASDVDLIVIYDAPEGARSAGAAPLDAVTWAGRLVRRFYSAISMPTEEGALYEVDMQLRPSGAKGPAAVRLSAFRKYYQNDAWTWEKMALVKARVIAGAPRLGAEVAAEIERILRQPRDLAAIAADAASMRARLAEAKPAIGPWDLKAAPGGATDLDFIVQVLTLAEASAARLQLHPETMRALAALRDAGALGAADALLLSGAHQKFEAAMQLSRAASGGVFAPGGAGEAVRRLMAAVFQAASLPDAEQKLIALEFGVRSVYETVVAGPRVAGAGRGE
ncbi:MAG: bifunctional [glutamine synthetase] adenylyltransferase/[glutamine synthetase]-adenylyl-L-tyrosine phosphorylase [Parvularculaceae bacterium]